MSPRQVSPALVGQRQARSAALAAMTTGDRLMAWKDEQTDAAILLMLPGCPPDCPADHEEGK